MPELEKIPPDARDPLNRFCNRASDYAQYRPSYPTAAIDIILERIVSSSQLVVADVGAGTGISSQLLAERGVRVIAIEPNIDMRQLAVSHPLVEFRDATAEATGLRDASVDLVTCFQSFHWFDPEPTLKEFNRIVKPLGRVVAVWNQWDEHDEFTANFTQLLPGEPNDRSNNEYFTNLESIASHYLADIQHHVFQYKQELDLTALLGLPRSHSNIPVQGLAFQQMVSDLQQLHANFCDEHGMISLLYRTIVFLAKPKPYIKLG